MKITKSEDCDKCRGCCKFEKDEEYYAPLFSEEEVNRLDLKSKLLFKKYKNSNNVFQIQLIRSKKEKGISVCPLLDEDNHLCKIYENRPFDCEFWPFALTKSKDGKSINLSCLDKDLCPSVENMEDELFEKHKKSAIEMVNSDKYKRMIKKYPDLAWHYEDDYILVKTLN